MKQRIRRSKLQAQRHSGSTSWENWVRTRRTPGKCNFQTDIGRITISQARENIVIS